MYFLYIESSSPPIVITYIKMEIFDLQNSIWPINHYTISKRASLRISVYGIIIVIRTIARIMRVAERDVGSRWSSWNAHRSSFSRNPHINKF
ncbi:hypothetical protein RJT34_06424 [Clitoria ternatea]|uniref:Uncharacterized protein n=1 Tax=Clitoria ternatea TaxID=43366 RepID=A0AAN9K3E4_CLITE